MDVDSLDLLEERDSGGSKREDHLNSWVAVAIAILAAFMGICSIKDGNIVQSMQQAQAKSIDTWNYYQAKNIRQDVYQATADELRLQVAQQTAPAGRSAFGTELDRYQKLADNEKIKKEKL